MSQQKSRERDGITLFAFDAKNLDRIEAALDLIRDANPVRYRRLCKDLDRIAVRFLPGSIGRFSPRTNTCELEARYLEREDVATESVAALIVHEATHARLFQVGIGYPESLRERIEDFCVRQEWLFGEKLENGAEVCAKASKYFAASAPDFSNVAMFDRHIQGFIDILRHAGMSETFASRVLTFLKWIGRKKRHRLTQP